MSSAKTVDPVKQYITSEIDDIPAEQVRQFAAIIWGDIGEGDYCSAEVTVTRTGCAVVISIWKKE
jgi:hypothetical protein